MLVETPKYSVPMRYQEVPIWATAKMLLELMGIINWAVFYCPLRTHKSTGFGKIQRSDMCTLHLGTGENSEKQCLNRRPGAYSWVQMHSFSQWPEFLCQSGAPWLKILECCVLAILGGVLDSTSFWLLQAPLSSGNSEWKAIEIQQEPEGNSGTLTRQNLKLALISVMLMASGDARK